MVETSSNGNTIYYTYDVDGSLLSMNYNGSEYFYITNLQCDVIELVNMNGITVATYMYDAWGNTISKTGSIADINPYRYRGYRLDTETGYYYLQSRYYNPQIGRFISADGQVNEGILGENMYAYAENNPVMNVDPKGTKVWHFILGYSNMIIGYAVSMTSPLIGGAIMVSGIRFVREGHYDRNYLNTDLPTDPTSALNAGWVKQEHSAYHQFSDLENEKWLSSDGHREIIFDKSGKIVNDPRDIGTYNYVPNSTSSFGHGIVDVAPWLFWGNNHEDETTFIDRFKLWARKERKL